MQTVSDRSHTVEIVPCAGQSPSFRWIIRGPDGEAVRHSPYAFSTEKGARISASCWSRELTETSTR